MTIAESIQIKLEKCFSPHLLVIEDQSYLHKGHAGYQEGGESHFFIKIGAKSFAGKTRLERHRLIHEALAQELQKIHALALEISE